MQSNLLLKNPLCSIFKCLSSKSAVGKLLWILMLVFILTEIFCKPHGNRLRQVTVNDYRWKWVEEGKVSAQSVGCFESTQHRRHVCQEVCDICCPSCVLHTSFAVMHSAVAILILMLNGWCAILTTGFPHLLESPGFFLENSRTWKVLEKHFGPGKSWNWSLRSWKVLEKYPWELHIFIGSNGKQAEIVNVPVFADVYLLK